MSAIGTVTLQEGLAHLAAICGAEHTHLAGETIRVAPSCADDLAQILKFANQSQLSVTPTGSGSKLGWGNPVSPEIVLSLERLNCVREHAWQDLTCTVESGCMWSAMQAELARHGQMVALDPLWPDRATVGGVVATNDSGSLRLRYGGLRDLIIGMTIVLPDGSIAKTGGKVVKNVAGYDLHKLVTGSFGTLGVITEVNFRLYPVERNARTFTVTTPDVSRLAQPLRQLLHVQTSPSAVQIRLSKEHCALDVRLCARAECLDEHTARLRSIFDGLSISDPPDSVWTAREPLFAYPNALVAKASVVPADLCAIVAEMRQAATGQGIEINLVAQANGLITLALVGSDDSLATWIAQLGRRIRPTGGSIVLLRMPEALNGKIDRWDCETDSLALMREIKRRFDPNRVLNPGRFVGGI